MRIKEVFHLKKFSYALVIILVCVLVFSLSGLTAERLTAYVSLDEEIARAVLSAFQNKLAFR